MPTPIALCVENIGTGSAGPAFMRCVAVAGRQPGLGLDATGNVVWKDKSRLACELWVSADDCLILYRPNGAPPVSVHRAGRSLDVPFAKPVVVIDQDEMTLGGRRLRLHVHGAAPTVAAPSPLVQEPSLANRIAKGAAVVAIGSAAATGCIDVRDKPPDMSPAGQNTNPPIEVRDKPPEVMAAPVAPKLPTPTATDANTNKQPRDPATNQTNTPIQVRDNPPLIQI